MLRARCYATAGKRRRPGAPAPPRPPAYEPQVTAPLRRPPEPLEVLPGLADDDFGFHYVQVEAPKRDAVACARETQETSEVMALQSKMSGARSVGIVLECVTSHKDQLDALHAATALHRIARLGRISMSHPICETLFKRLEEPGAVENLGAQAQVCLLWSLGRLSFAPPFLRPLMTASRVADFSGHQLATALYSLAHLELNGLVSTWQEHQSLVEALHREAQRRQKALGPGATSAMDTILLADALAKLQIRDEVLFTSIASAICKHLDAHQLKIREIRHAASAFSQMGMVEKQLMTKMMSWLRPRLGDCSSNDLSALAFSFSRAVAVAGREGRDFFGALLPQLVERHHRGEINAREAAGLIVSYSQANVLDEHAVDLMRLIPLIERSPSEVNGQWLALLVPCISHLAKPKDSLWEVLAERTSQLAATLSPRQLARLAIGFGQAQVQSQELWQSLTREAMSKSVAFSAPDTLRFLAGFDAAMGSPNRGNMKLLKTFWARVAEKQAKYLAEELLALLQLWPRLPPELRSEGLPRELMKHLRNRLEKGTKGLGWTCPPELGVELLEWLPSSRNLTSTARPLDLRLLRAVLLQLPRQLRQSHPEMRMRLLKSLTQDAELWFKARSEVLQDQAFHHAWINMSKDCSPSAKSFSMEVAVETMFCYAQLGIDNKEVLPFFQQLLQHAARPTPALPSLASLAQLCWSCAELRIHEKEAKILLGKVVEAMKSEDGDELSLLRLAWSSLALGCMDEPLLTFVKITSGESLMLQLSPCDLRPLQQLAWHCLQHHGSAGHWSAAILEAGPQLPRTPTSRDGTPGQTDAEKMLSSLLQNLRVPHVVASSQAVPGNIYRLPLWFPHANAVLELNTTSDRLVSGKLSGTAEMRRKQLREAGLKVHSFDMSVLRKATHLQQLCAVAETIASSCPEAQSWLDSEIPQAMNAAAPQLTES